MSSKQRDDSPPRARAASAPCTRGAVVVRVRHWQLHSPPEPPPQPAEEPPEKATVVCNDDVCYVGPSDAPPVANGVPVVQAQVVAKEKAAAAEAAVKASASANVVEDLFALHDLRTDGLFGDVKSAISRRISSPSVGYMSGYEFVTVGSGRQNDLSHANLRDTCCVLLTLAKRYDRDSRRFVPVTSAKRGSLLESARTSYDQGAIAPGQRGMAKGRRLLLEKQVALKQYHVQQTRDRDSTTVAQGMHPLCMGFAKVARLESGFFNGLGSIIEGTGAYRDSLDGGDDEFYLVAADAWVQAGFASEDPPSAITGLAVTPVTGGVRGLRGEEAAPRMFRYKKDDSGNDTEEGDWLGPGEIAEQFLCVVHPLHVEACQFGDSAACTGTPRIYKGPAIYVPRAKPQGLNGFCVLSKDDNGYLYLLDAQAVAMRGVTIDLLLLYTAQDVALNLLATAQSPKSSHAAARKKVAPLFAALGGGGVAA